MISFAAIEGASHALAASLIRTPNFPYLSRKSLRIFLQDDSASSEPRISDYAGKRNNFVFRKRDAPRHFTNTLQRFCDLATNSIFSIVTIITMANPF